MLLRLRETQILIIYSANQKQKYMEEDDKMKNATGTPVHSADRRSFIHHDLSISNLPASFLRRAITLMMTLLLLLCFSTAAFAEFSHASEAQPIALESSVEAEISVGGDYVYYSFVPAASGTYYFFSTGDEDTYAYLYDSNGTQLAYDDDGGSNGNFKISYYFEAGQQYFLGARFYTDALTGSFTVHLESPHGLISATTADGSTYSSLKVVMNETATMRVYVTCTEGDSLHYAWYRNDNESILIEGANEATYTSGPVTDRCYYYCVVSDDYGNTQTVSFEVQIDNALKFEGGEATRTVTVQPHESVTLKATASCRDGELSYTWRDGSWNTMDSTTDTFILENVNKTENYFCTVDDQYGNSAQLWFYIRVDNAFSVKDRYKTQDVYVSYGEGTTLNVVASCRDGDLSYQWQHDGSPLPNETLPTLQIHAVTNAGDYYCTVQDQYGNEAIVNFRLNVENGFYVMPVGPTDRYLPQNDVTTLSVRAGCTTGELSYEWRRDETGQVMGATDTITSAPVTTGYDDYRCRVSDQYGNFKDIHYTLHLDNELRVWAVSENPVYLSKKSDVTMTVGAECKTGELRYRWGRMEKDAARTFTYLGTFSGPEGATFTAEDVNSACYYYCDVVDQYENSSYIYFDIVWDNNFTAPAHSPLRLVNPGESVTMTTNVTCASGNLSYQWIEAPLNGYSYYNDVISTERALTVSCDQSKTYRCFVQDEYGNGTDYTFIILVKQSTGAIALNQPTEVATTVDLQGKAFTFTPAVTGSYQFSGEGTTPLCAAMMSDDGVQWYYTGVTPYSDFSNFMKLEAGRTYTYYAMSTVLNSSFEVYLELLEAEVQHAQNQLILPAGTKRIDEGAFAGIGAEEVVLPNGCEYISAGAFANCPNLRLINIPDSVTFIADSAFAGCNVSLIQDGRSNYARQYAVNHGLGWIVPEN